jgi:hypothetical protein
VEDAGWFRQNNTEITLTAIGPMPRLHVESQALSYDAHERLDIVQGGRVLLDTSQNTTFFLSIVEFQRALLWSA